MLSSISPVGEAARQQRWSITVTAYLVASALAGAALGAALGLLGDLAGLDAVGAVGLVVVVAAGLIVDATVGPLSVHRQVDERWLSTYRGWVYGAGFGAQLGVGVVTIVPSSVVWVTWAAAAFSGTPARGAAVGLTFGLLRALPLLAGGRATTPARLRGLLRSMDRWRDPVTKLTVVGQVAVLLGAVAALVR